MTIILQHQFWDLSVNDQAFEVGLSFKNVPEMLLIPFEAITRFSDPSVPFDIDFDPEDEAGEASANDAGSAQEESPSPDALEPARLGPHALGSHAAGSHVLGPHALGADGVNPRDGVAEPAEAGGAGAALPPDEAKVVSIDAFRKKT